MRRALVALAAITASGLLLAVGYRGYDYVEHDPRFCQSCHLMERPYARWETSVHREVGCHACHVQSTAESLRQLYLYVTLRPTTVSHHAVVDFTRCGACHLSRDPRWKQVADTAGHKVHFAQLGFQCVACHSRGVHNFVRPTDSCSECHTAQAAGDGAMGSVHCTACHDFLATDHALADLRRSDCLACHDQMQVGHEHFDPQAPMQFPCQQCHRPHERILPSVADCQHCHHVHDFGLHAVPFHADCKSCHQPHLWRVDARATCERCHGDRHDGHYPDLPCAGCHDFQRSAPVPSRGAPLEPSS